MLRLLISLLVLTRAGSVGIASPLKGGAKAIDLGRTSRVVRGLDGQADLQLDHGRSLHRYPLTRRAFKELFGINKPVRGHASWLRSIEKVRLDARRIGGSRLLPTEQLARLLHIVRLRMPFGVTETRYDDLVAGQVRRWRTARLSHHVHKRVGLCKERAFLLQAMMKEAGHEARVKYGVVYDKDNNFLGGHAWVEARVGGKDLLLEPQLLKPVKIKRKVIEELMEDGTSRNVRAAEIQGVLYVPTGDLSYR